MDSAVFVQSWYLVPSNFLLLQKVWLGSTQMCKSGREHNCSSVDCLPCFWSLYSVGIEGIVKHSLTLQVKNKVPGLGLMSNVLCHLSHFACVFCSSTTDSSSSVDMRSHCLNPCSSRTVVVDGIVRQETQGFLW